VIVPPQAQPARNYAEALARLDSLARLDGGEILEAARSAWFVTGSATPLAVVLLHGYTNNPAQYAAFAPQLHARGVNVVIPRMPLHGYRDRMTTVIAGLTADAVVAKTAEALDIASGLGESVGVLGISMDGALAALFAQYRTLSIAVPVAPDFALLRLSYGMTRALAWLTLRLPNMFLWWDPRDRAQHVPSTAYPRLSTHALARTLSIGDAVVDAAKRAPQRAERIVALVNRADPAVNNVATHDVVRSWQKWRTEGAAFVELTDLPRNHDVVSPDDPLARVELVYPKLLAALGV
jgi:alpha-beta hydrolase superfamily lysophospholipase